MFKVILIILMYAVLMLIGQAIEHNKVVDLDVEELFR